MKFKSPVVYCNNQNCQKGEIFHLECMDLAEDEVTEEWYCSTESIRENDGPLIMSQRKYDLIGFHNRHHYKYVINAHRLIASISGWHPERLRQDLIWNRAVNLSGGPGRNPEADLVNELLNKEFKESLKDAVGNLTPETVARHSQLVGHMRKELNRIYMEQMAEAKIQKQTKHYKSKFDEDINKFVEILKDENLFSSIPGRQFKSFKNFSYSPSSVKPSALNKKLYQLSATS
ncbi:uncharacterized protein LOC130014046 [Patella vulgata]|uniref:uncharacterized protein LOC130014046 n=1 Tax=Patella vulgata TaxID=6465 RepID=UPI0024AA0271|nr:uncharacterized protein LOC130014046 [Patella vulgata]